MAPTLADSLAVGDPAAFAALYDRLAIRLFNTARTLTSTADAEDIVHDVFVDLARSRERLNQVVDLEAYVFTMLRHAVSRRRRRVAIDRKAMDRIAAERARNGSGSESPPQLPDDELAAAVAALPAEQREVIALKITGGLTFAAIATVTNTSLNTAASRYRYALEKLRATLATVEVRR
ncbi:MAG: sigma-70 family RNA polymerase sigma factor [Planctomycetia bacterium]|nr:sigma-70 family RNA polymerase sigma factor [Planctomycetia bacterium]